MQTGGSDLTLLLTIHLFITGTTQNVVLDLATWTFQKSDCVATFICIGGHYRGRLIDKGDESIRILSSLSGLEGAASSTVFISECDSFNRVTSC